MRAIQFQEYGGPEVLTVEELEASSLSPDESLVEVRASSVNPSDIANVKGAFGASTPRVPGRDYAGVVVDGSPDWIGVEVWGASPSLGVGVDGAHAEHVVVKTASLAEKPAELSMEEAATFGIPYLAAWGALVNAGEVEAGETILITGAAGAVGEAATQIAHWKGAIVIGVDLADGPTDADTYIRSVGQDITPAVRAATDGGHGVDLALDAVGGSMFEPSLRSLRTGGRQIAIAAAGGMRRVEFDLVEFFHGLNRLIGVDTNAYSATEIAQSMNRMTAGVRAGKLRPRAVQTWTLDNSADAYKAVAAGPTATRHIIVP
jgi:NADPH2:quinone reductase